jgi:hypothetical protein
MNTTGLIMEDYYYKQNPDGSYIVSSSGALEKADRNKIMDKMISTLRCIYDGIEKKLGAFDELRCNAYLLDEALLLYSRDVFGEQRLKSKITALRLTDEQRENLSEFSTYGLKIDSCQPYVHRQVARLLYWLSVLKPFAFYPKDAKAKERLGLAFTFHNEFASYLLILSILKRFGLMLNIHDDKAVFSDFLFELHFRNLSRSSLEFFLGNYLVNAP